MRHSLAISFLVACGHNADPAPAPTFQDLKVTYQVALSGPWIEYSHPGSHPAGTLEMSYHAASANHTGAQLCVGSMPISTKSYVDITATRRDLIILQLNVDGCPALDNTEAHVAFTPTDARDAKLDAWMPTSSIAKSDSH